MNEQTCSRETLREELSRTSKELVTAQCQLRESNAALEQALLALNEKQRQLTELSARFEEVATTDSLTGIKNRRAFQERLPEEVARATRYGTTLSLILLDVDHFKDYNDSFGHPAGDEALQKVARLLCEASRCSDFVARYGGEEFAVVTPNTDAGGALALAERLRVAIESELWPRRAVTASFGVASLLSGMDSATLLSLADQALYHSKREGRNRVTQADAPALSVEKS